MRKTTKFLITTTWIVTSRIYDAYCTFQLTPDLAKEANPLVSIFGFSWIPLLVIISLLTIYAIFVYYLTTFSPKDLLPEESGYSFSETVAYLYLGKKVAWTSILYKFPGNLDRFNHYMGHVLTRNLVFAGFLSTIMWLLINYTSFYKDIHSPALVYTLLIIGCLIIVYSWNKEQFMRYRKVG